MDETLQQQRRSPLADSVGIDHSNALPGDAGVKLSEQPQFSHLVLRGQMAITAAKQRAIELPDSANTVVFSTSGDIFWRGPDEWLLLYPHLSSNELIQHFQTVIGTSGGACTDVSAGQTVLVVSGPDSRSVLAKGTTIDLHPRSLPIGRCAQTLLAQTSVLIWPHSIDDYRIVVRRSFADYLWQWLIDASGEYGCAIIDNTVTQNGDS